MASVQNSFLSCKTLLEPTLYMGLALLAGSTRLIEVFPGASQEGLLLAGGMGSASALLYNRMFHHEEHSYFRTLLGKATLIAFGTLCTTLIAKPLKGRVEIHFPSAVKFAFVQLSVATVTTYLLQESELQRKHRLYSGAEQKAWRGLPTDELTALVKEFYEGGLPAISLLEAQIGCDFFDPYDTLMANLHQYTKEQLSWYRELLSQGGSDEKCFSFMKRCTDVGLPMIFFPMGENVYHFIENKPHYIDLVYAQFKETPIFPFFCKADFTPLFQGKPPLPSFEEVVKTLDVSQVEGMDPQVVIMWHHAFRDQNPIHWGYLSAPIQTAFVKRFFELQATPPNLFLDPSLDKGWLITYLNETPDLSKHVFNLEWLHVLLRESPQGISFKKVCYLNQNWPGIIPYPITPTCIAKAKEDPALVETLKRQFQHAKYGNDFGFLQLPLEQQEELRQVFDDQAYLLPYRVTPELITQAEQQPQLLDQLKGLFDRGMGRDYGLFDLSPPDQERLRLAFGHDAYLLPQKLTSEVVASALESREQLQLLMRQFQRSEHHFDFGFYALPLEDQIALLKACDTPQHLPPFQLSPALVAKAEQDRDILGFLINQHYHAGGRNFGFKELPKEDQTKLRALFEAERAAHYLPKE
ncbi:MAG: hypothetical protein AB7N99_06165 [Simkaniaceae bacterium]